MTWLNNDQRNQAVAMLNAGTLVNVESRLFWMHLKDDWAFVEKILGQGNVHDRPRSGRSHVTTAADDPCIIVQHFLNRCRTAAARKQHGGIQHRCSNDLRVHSIKFLPNVIGWQGATGAAIVWASGVLIRNWPCFPTNLDLTLTTTTWKG